MDLSIKWLNDFVKTNDIPIKSFTEGMTMSGSKVEGYKTEGDEIKGVVVGKVLSIEKHPNADTLYICKVDVNAPAPLQIVTGATNVISGTYVPVAMNGSVLPGDKKINTGKLRGELSEGMLCSLQELGLSKNDFPYADENGIFLLGEDCEQTLGVPIQEAIGLNDTVVEFEITPNRPDCLSVIGLAREAAATFNKSFSQPAATVKAGGGKIEDLLSVTVENNALCMRYAAAAVKNVKIATSPRWLRERLRASGVRPISNIVDITNYVMLEYGHPMHAFDLRHVKDAKIIVRNAKPGEQITTLDGIERMLSPEMLVIADAESPSAVAGVMGGEYSGVYDDTTTVIFEAACFDGASVRTTAKKLGLRTESSSRFEKGLDPENCALALRRACELVEQLGAGVVADGFLDVYGNKADETVLTLDAAWINAFLGVEIPETDMVNYLRALNFNVDGRKIKVPSFRADVKCAADIAEEIARMYGYNNIPVTPLRGAARGTLSAEQKFERIISQTLISCGYSEIVTYSFISPKYYDKINLPKESKLRDSVVISNPLGEDTSVMRTTALPSMMETVARNYNNRNPMVRLYEIATEYLPATGEKLPYENRQIMLGAYGADCDFFELKAAVESLLERVGITGWEMVPVSDNPTFHPGRTAMLTVAEETLGILGEIHPEVAESYGVTTKVYVARLDFAALQKHAKTEKQFTPLPKFPSSSRDLALVCDESLPVATMQKEIASAVGKILEKIELFDVYRGKQIGEGKKSVAFSLIMRAPDRTLTDVECDGVVQKALKNLQKVGAQLR